MWYDRKVDTRYPANVLSGFEPSAGATFFNLNQLQVCGGGGGRLVPGLQCVSHAIAASLWVAWRGSCGSCGTLSSVGACSAGAGRACKVRTGLTATDLP